MSVFNIAHNTAFDDVSALQGHISEAFKRPVLFDLPEIVFKKQAKEQPSEPVSLVSLFGEDPVGL